MVFDLDGTLIDSVGGIAESVNRTRADFGFAPLPRKIIESFTGDGVKKLLERSFADVSMPVPVNEILAVNVKHYADDPVYDTELYPGVKEGLAKLCSLGWVCCVVSNKPQEVGTKILRHFGIDEYIAAHIGGEAGFPLKPAPDAMIHLLEKYHALPADSWVIGDNHTDMNFAANAGVRAIFCRYGFGFKADSKSSFEVDDFAEAVRILS